MKRKGQLAAAAVVLSVAGLMLWRSRPSEASSPNGPTPTAWSVIAPKANPNPQDGQRPHVDIVFALDTTSSMSGLIDGAKQKIWEIARHAQEGQPAPEVRIGLVAYRDIGDDYVTKVLDLTGDLDKVYATLTGFQAGGGGDGPEHVIKGLHDAVNGVQWSKDTSAVKLVYLVGDAPPHEDYQDGLTLERVLADAQEKGIRISAIRCGNDSATLAKWSSIARKTEGEVSSIEQNGGVHAAAPTPYDAELARLNGELAKTEVHFGSADERKVAAEVVAANVAAPAAAQVERAAFYAAQASGPGARGAATKKDLAAADPSALDKVATADLPEPMQAMSTEERAKFVETKHKEREAVLAQIKETNARRDAVLSAAPKPAASSDGFDAKVMGSLKKAGAAKGISY